MHPHAPFVASYRKAIWFSCMPGYLFVFRVCGTPGRQLPGIPCCAEQLNIIEHDRTWFNTLARYGKILLLHWSCSVSARCLTTFAIPPWSPTQLNHFTPFHTISHHFTLSPSLSIWLYYMYMIICICRLTRMRRHFLSNQAQHIIYYTLYIRTLMGIIWWNSSNGF